jgi:hypothetical protein
VGEYKDKLLLNVTVLFVRFWRKAIYRERIENVNVLVMRFWVRGKPTGKDTDCCCVFCEGLSEGNRERN